MVNNAARTEAELKRMVMPDLRKVADYVAQKIWNENREKIRVMIYEAYDPIEYDRTGEFKEAWGIESYVTGDVATSEFKFDPDQLTSFDNHHASIIDGQPMQDYLVNIIYQGLSGAIYQEGYAKNSKRFKGQSWTKARNVWNALIKWLGADRMRKLFEEGMRFYGIEFTRHKSAIFFVKD